MITFSFKLSIKRNMIVNLLSIYKILKLLVSKTACEDILSFAKLYCTAYKTQQSAKLKVFHLVIKNIIL